MIPDEYRISMQDKKSGGKDDDGGTGTVTLTRAKTQKAAPSRAAVFAALSVAAAPE